MTGAKKGKNLFPPKITSLNVFTRTGDGPKVSCYIIYIILFLLIISEKESNKLQEKGSNNFFLSLLIQLDILIFLFPIHLLMLCIGTLRQQFTDAMSSHQFTLSCEMLIYSLNAKHSKGPSTQMIVRETGFVPTKLILTQWSSRLLVTTAAPFSHKTKVRERNPKTSFLLIKPIH